MNIASTVSVAALANPESPCSVADRPLAGSLRTTSGSASNPRSTASAESGSTTSSATSTPMAVMSTGTGSVAKSTSATRMTAKTNSAPAEIPNGTSG